MQSSCILMTVLSMCFPCTLPPWSVQSFALSCSAFWKTLHESQASTCARRVSSAHDTTLFHIMSRIYRQQFAAIPALGGCLLIKPAPSLSGQHPADSVAKQVEPVSQLLSAVA